jgi:hypothetical protein
MKNVLQTTSVFQNGAQDVLRYENNIYVDGDNVAEHIARGCRLIAYISPLLLEEFPKEKNLIQDIFSTFVVHDDDEIIDGKDIVTYNKAHNVKDNKEIEMFFQSTNNLDKSIKMYIQDMFKSFRHKDSLAAKISKQIDNIVGNQLVIEQKIGLISHRIAKFAIDYVTKVRELSGSSTMMKLIDAQIQQVHEERKIIISNEELLDDLLTNYIKKNSQNLSLAELKKQATKLLHVELAKITLDGVDVGAKLEDIELI